MKKDNIMNNVKRIRAVIEGRRRKREHILRCITIRTSDGTNQCVPVGSWSTILKRIYA